MESKSGARIVIPALAIVALAILVTGPLVDPHIRFGPSSAYLACAGLTPLLLAISALPRARRAATIGLWVVAVLGAICATTGVLGALRSGFRFTDLLTFEGLAASIPEVMTGALAVFALTAALLASGAGRRRRGLVVSAVVLAALLDLGMAIGLTRGIVWLGARYRTSGEERWGLIEAGALLLAAVAVLGAALWWARWAPHEPSAATRVARWVWGLGAGVVVVALVAAGGTWWVQHRVSRVNVAQEFSDPALARCVEDTVGGSAAPADTLATLVDLDCSHAGAIASLEGIGTLSKLSTLNLANNHVTNIGPLAGLHHLSAVNLSQNAVTDLTALHGLNQLRSVNIANNHVADLSPLAGLPLQTLQAGNNEITTLTALGPQPTLAILDVGGNRLSGVVSIDAMRGLDQLDLSRNQVTGISDVCAQGNPRQFHADHNEIADAAQFAGCTATTELWIGANPVADISALSAMPKLIGVDVSDTGQLPAGIDVLSADGIYVGGQAK